jgi:hypothetical protein
VRGETGVPPIAPVGSDDPYAPGGSKTVCTAKAMDQRTGAWKCTEYTLTELPPVGRAPAAAPPGTHT